MYKDVITHPLSHTHRNSFQTLKKKNGILPFVITWIDPEGIMLGEISQRNTNAI